MDSRSLARLSYISIALVFLVTAFGVALSGTAAADIAECTVLDEPRQTYELVDDIEASETCIEITADRVTLEGNGHSITGDGSDTEPGSAGVLVEDATDVTVANVSFEGWRNGAAGVRYLNADGGRITGVDALENSYSVFIESSEDVELLESDVDGGIAAEITGVLVESSSMVTVADSEFEGNSNDGLAISNSSQVTVDGSDFRRNGEGAVVENSSTVTFLESTFADNDDSGVVFHDSSDNEVTDSHAFGNDEGFRLVESTDNLLRGNTADNNSVHGFSVEFRSDDNELSNNLAEHNDIHGFSLASSDRNMLEENTALDNGVMGFSLDSSSDNEVVDNTADRNIGGFGLLLSADNNTLERNTATNNSFAGEAEDEDSVGISVESSDNNTLRGNAVDLNDEDGILLRNSDGNHLENNTADDNGVDDDTGDGITLETSNDNVLVGNSGSGNPRAGVALVDESDGNLVSGSTVQGNAVGVVLLGGVTGNTVEDNEVRDNDEQGVILVNDASGNEVTGNHVENNTDGVALIFSADNNIVEENVLMENDEGLVVLDGSSGNQLEFDRVRDSSTAAANVTNASGNSFTELDVGSSTRDNTTVSFTADYYRVSPVSSAAVNPESESVGRYLELTGTDGASEADVTFHYLEEDVDGLDEDTLAVWRHEGGDDWTELESTVDTMEQTVSAEALESTVYGVFADELEPAEFTVEVVATNSPVVEGEALDVEVNVTNTGDIEDTQDVRLEDFEDVERDSVEVELSGGESTELTLTWNTGGGDSGEGDVNVYTDDDSDNRSVQVLEQAYFDVEILDANSPVTEGGSLDVDVEVTNTGETTEAKKTWLEDFDGVEQDNETVELDGGDSTELRVTWETETGDAGEDEVTVLTEDSSDTAAVEIQEPDAPFFDVKVTATNTPVTEGETLVVDVNVTNLGEEQDTQEVNFTDFDGVERGSQQVDLEGGEYDDTLEFTWDTEEGDAGVGDVTVSSEDDDFAQEVAVQAEGEVRVCQEIDEPGSYVLPDDLEAEETCLEVTADDVEIHAQGHTVSNLDPGDSEVGLRASGVQNLSLTGFEFRGWNPPIGEAVAVELIDTTDVNINDSEFRDNMDGVVILESENVLVSDTVFRESSDYAVAIESSESVNVEDIDVESTGEAAVYLHSTEVGTVSESEFRDGGHGVHLEDSSNISVIDNELYNGEWAVLIEEASTANEVRQNYLEDVAVGVRLMESNENQVTNNTVTDTRDDGDMFEGVAVFLGQADDNQFEGNSYIDVEHSGVMLVGSSGNTFLSDEANVYPSWSVEIDTEDFAGSVDNTFEAFGVGESTAEDTRLSWGGELVRIGAVGTPPDNPDASSIGRYFEAEEVDDGAFLDVEVSYDEDDLGFVDESSLELWRYSSTEEDWSVVEGSGVDTAEQVVYADDVEEFGVFGVFGEEEEQPFFDVEVEETNSPVEEGEPLVVEGVVENEGNVADEQEIVLRDSDWMDSDVDSMELELDPLESMEFELEWTTEEGDAGEGDVTVYSENSSDSTLVEVVEPPESFFDVDITDTNSPVVQGEPLDVDVQVTNTGEADTQTLELGDFDGAVVDTHELSVDENASESVTLTWGTEFGDAGEGSVSVSSDDSSDSTTVVVEEEVEEVTSVESCGEIASPGEYRLESDLSSDETCITVTAGDVRLDGDGHSIQGVDPAAGDNGILVDGVDGVRVEDVAVEDWDAAGVEVDDADGGEVVDVTAMENLFGVVVESSNEVAVEGGEMTANEEAGVVFSGSSDGRVAEVMVSDSGARGIALGGDSDRNVVSGNEVVGAGDEAIYLQEASENEVSDNQVSDGDSGIEIRSSSNSNEILGNAVSGFEASGIVVYSSSENDIADNEVSDSEFGVSVLSGSRENTFSGNLMEEAEVGVLGVESIENEFTGNTVSGGSVGMRFEASSNNMLTSNLVEDNGVGFRFERFSLGNTVAESTVRGSGNWSVVVEDAEDNTFTDVVLAGEDSYSTRLSWTGVDIRLDAVEEAPVHLTRESLERYVEAELLSADAYLDVSLIYEDGDVEELDEDTVGLWRYSSGMDEWLEVDADVDTDSNQVSSGDVEEGVHGLFGELEEPPDPVYNPDRSLNYSSIQEALDDAEDGDEIVVRSGFYTGGVTLNVSNVTLRSADDASVALSSAGAAVSIEAAGVEVRDITLLGSPDAAVSDFEDVELNSTGLENETVSLEDVSDVIVDSSYVEELPSEVEVEEEFGSYVEVDPGENASVASFAVTPASGVGDPEGVALWKHDGDGWTELVDSMVDGDEVSVELSGDDFSTFAPFRTSDLDERDDEDDEDADGDEGDTDDGDGGEDADEDEGDTDDGDGGEDADEDEGDTDDGVDEVEVDTGGSVGGGAPVGDDYRARIQTEPDTPELEVTREATAYVGETVTFPYEVAAERVGGERYVELKVDGRTVDSRSLYLATDESVEIEFEHTFLEVGEYEVHVDGEALADVVVIEEEPEGEAEDGVSDGDEADEDEEATVDEGEEAAPVDTDDVPGEGLPGFTAVTAVLALMALSLYLRRVN